MNRLKIFSFLLWSSLLLIIGYFLGQLSLTVKDLPLENEQAVKVSRIIDGDTIELENGQKVRYLNIDTPETVDPRKPVQCFGKEASEKNRELVEGKIVRLEKDVTDKDKYGRLLRYVWVGETMINLELVKLGYARIYTYPPDVKYQKEILSAEKTAREQKLGLWQNCE